MRYAPERSFPDYAFVPGKDPHPTRDPRGHSYGHEAPAPAHLAPEDWAENGEYLWGVDLYNHGFLWEAHEAWEGLWHPSKRTDPLQASHLQGLIQCAAACLKVTMGQPRGLSTLAALGTEKLERVARQTGGTFMGVPLFDFVAEMRDYAESAPDSIEGRPVLELER